MGRGRAEAHPSAAGAARRRAVASAARLRPPQRRGPLACNLQVCAWEEIEALCPSAQVHARYTRRDELPPELLERGGGAHDGGARPPHANGNGAAGGPQVAASEPEPRAAEGGEALPRESGQKRAADEMEPEAA